MNAILPALALACVLFLSCISPAMAQDAYEPDDTFSQARVIVVDDADAQRHDFSKAADEDWVKFYAVAGNDYVIAVNNAGPNCDAVIELYGPDGITLLAPSKDANPAGRPENLTLRAASDSLVFVKVRGYNGMVYGDGTGYDLRVYRPIGPPMTAILTGKVYEFTTGTPVDNAVLRSSGGGSGISIDSGFYFLREYEQYITLSVQAEGFKPFSTQLSLTPAAVTSLDIPLEMDTSYGCTAQLHQDLALLIPRILIGDSFIWATMKYDPSWQDKIIFEVMGAGFVTDAVVYGSCTPPTLTAELKLDIPAISFGSMLLSAGMELYSIDGSRIFFEVKTAKILNSPGL